MRATFFAWLLLAAVTTSSQGAGHDKAIKHEDAKAQQPQTQPTLDTSSLEKTIREAVKEASEKPDAGANEKLEMDRKLTEYTEQLSVYTQKLSQYTLWLVIATGLLAVIAIYQGVQLQRAVELGRHEFIASNRPRVVLRAISSAHHQVAFEDPIYVVPDDPIECVFVNIGGTEARLVEFEAALLARHNKQFPPLGSQGQNKIVFTGGGQILRNGERFSHASRFVLDLLESSQVQHYGR